MNQQKKELLKSIDALEERINLAKCNKERDKQYLISFFERHQYVLVSLIFPAFMLGWKGGKNSRGKHFLQGLGKYSLIGLYKLFSNYNKII